MYDRICHLAHKIEEVSIQIMHIREVVSKNYSPQGKHTRLKAECVLEFYKVTEGG